MNIFPTQPRLTKHDAHNLLPHTGNVRIPLKKFLATNPDIDTLKKLVLLEIEVAKTKEQPMQFLRRGVVKTVLKRIQEIENTQILNNIENEIRTAKR